ncbi:flagellar hook-length control protein FliK [Chania multitudinisentens]|uniref:flagellar hook-length control protein FliK n=1 Tax=Chania multitudinisentens TaxID=1639108 RepID=UPI0003E1363E|nr:flagellar hook-length control protein FliK [Chania multitudinisentens]
MLNLSQGMGFTLDVQTSGDTDIPAISPASQMITQKENKDEFLNIINMLLGEQDVPLPPSETDSDIEEHKKDLPESMSQNNPLPILQPQTVTPQPLLQALLIAADTQQSSAYAIDKGPAPSLNLEAAQPPQLQQLTLDKNQPPVTSQELTPLLKVVNTPTPSVEIQPVARQDAALATPNASLKLNVNDANWAQQLQNALGERLQMQVREQTQHATIRLDPPEMGKLNISLHIENGRMQVQLNASHADVYRALQQTSNELRQSLMEQNFVQVNVQVSSQSRQQQGKDAPYPEQQTVLAGEKIASDEHQSNRGNDDSVLMTI